MPIRRARRSMLRKKPTMGIKKAQRKVARVQRKKASSNADTHSLKLVREFFVPAAAGASNPASAAFNYIGIWQPLAIDDATANAVYNFPEFQLYQQLYDRVRVNSVNITWQPRANVFDMSSVVNNPGTRADGDMNFHTVIDKDSRAPLNIFSLQRYASYKKFSILRKWSRTVRMTYPKGYWLNCQAPLTDTSTLQSIGGCSYLTAYAQDLPINIADPTYNDIGTFKITFNVVFQGKIVPKPVKNADGSVTIYSTHQVVVGNQSGMVPLEEGPVRVTEEDTSREVLPCECVGPTGPTGDTGPTGPTGPEGGK